jgi:S-DNA-T family DNA segregation ATPase FtsK/SpoIIIE
MTSRPRLPRRFEEAEPPTSDWLDGLARFNQRFGTYLRDLAGLALLALALISVIALMGGTRGWFISLWVEWIGSWFGWGGYLVAMAIGLLGVSLLNRSLRSWKIGRILWLELATLLTLGLLSALMGNSVDRADLGLDGGQIGWGMTWLLWKVATPIGGTLILFVAWLFAVASGFGLWTYGERWLRRVAGETPVPVEAVTESAPAVEDAREEESAPKQPAKKKPAPLPPEFRTSLRAPEKKNEKPVKIPPRDETLPPLTILLADQAIRADERTINQTAGLIMKTLSEFGIPATVIGYRVGPSVTQFAVQPGFIKKGNNPSEEDAQLMKVRVAQIASLEKDLTLALSAERLRIEAPVPGKPYVGIEVPNARSAVVRMRPLLESENFHKVGAPLAIALGRDVSGQPLIADLARMPHMLVAGSTGSGKSVFITALAACLAMNNTPEELRMVMIDAKMVELLRFNGLPHLYGKVETNVERILGVLRWVVVEMEHRYRLLEASHSRDLTSYNHKQTRKEGGQALPRIVVIIDELADLMMSAPDQTEHNLVRLAQMARATGIHLVVATQRPSTDVVTGLIKANFPARLAFAVASGVDSRVILDTTGAESLLGRGDMLFLNPEVGTPVRAQGVLITDMEIERLIAHWQKVSDVPVADVPPWEKLLTEPDEDEDSDLIEKATSIVRSTQRASASLLQRRLRIGYPRAARLLDQLEDLGVVGPSQGGGRERDVLVSETDEDVDDNGDK